jgi:LuxR family transcriptional regulator
MAQSASIAGILRDLDGQSPSGFAIALHIGFTTPAYLFQTYGRRWMDHYSEHGLVVNDPTVLWGLGKTGRIRWSDLESLDRAGVLEAARKHGLRHGVAVAILRGTRSIASFARHDREYDDFEMDDIEELVAELHDLTANLPELSKADRAALRELSIRLTH